VPVERPRGRTVAGGEIELATYAAFSNDDLLSQVGMEPMLAGVATRRYARVNEPVGDDLDAQATSTSRSSVSRRFKAATDAQLDELMSRDLSELDLAALMLDGVHFADAWCVVALAIGADGTKVPVGLWLGDTENKTVVTALLADLVDRGLNTDGGLLVVIDGAKALATAVRKVFGDTAFIQRCTLHKRRNVRDHLPKDQQAWVDRKLAAAFNHDDPAKGERALSGPRRAARGALARCGGEPARRPRGHVHRPAARCRRPARREPHEHELHREHDLDRARHDQEREAVARRQDDQTLVCRRDAQRGTQLPPAQGLPADADVRRCARPSPRSCSTGMRCCTSRMSGRTDAPPPSGRDSKLDAQTTSVPES
jgi:hypothetical protein